MKKYPWMKITSLCLLGVLLLFSLVACVPEELPEDAGDPAEALSTYAKEFWDSDIYENAIYDAIYNTDTASEALQSFNRVNALNAKNKIMTKSTYEAETVGIDGVTATVKLKIHGLDFGSYAETYVAEFDRLQASVAILPGGEVLGLSAEEVTFALQMLPFSIVEKDEVVFRDFEQEIKLKYQNGSWEIRDPKYDDGKVFLELFAEDMDDILKGKYKFRPGLGEE